MKETTVTHTHTHRVDSEKTKALHICFDMANQMVPNAA